jgi:hypothetical protein
VSLANIRNKAKVKPPRMILYGGSGIGQSTFGASLNKPIFLLVEDGLGRIEVDHFELAKDWKTFMDNLKSLLTEEHDYKSVVIDSLDWLEPLIWQEACDVNGWRSLEQPGYGKGYVEALKYWREYIDVLNELRDEKAMTILQIAHNQIKKFESPEIEPYDRHELKLHRKAADLLLEHSDCCFFANFKLGTVKVQGKGGNMTTKAVAGDRVIYTVERPAFLAKNRYGLDSELPFDWQAIREQMLK